MDALPMTLSPLAVAAFIALLGVLIFVHELGHFLVAKYFNIKVLKFSLGFGPPLLAFTRGETTYQIALIPLGGFVKMAGAMPGEELAPEDRGRQLARRESRALDHAIVLEPTPAAAASLWSTSCNGPSPCPRAQPVPASRHSFGGSPIWANC